DKILRDGIEKFVDYWENIPLFKTQKNINILAREQIRQQRLANNPIGLANSLKGMGTGAQPSYWDELAALDMPVLLLCGELDSKFCRISKEMQLLIKNADLVEVNEVGHAIHVEDPKKFG